MVRVNDTRQNELHVTKTFLAARAGGSDSPTRHCWTNNCAHGNRKTIRVHRKNRTCGSPVVATLTPPSFLPSLTHSHTRSLPPSLNPSLSPFFLHLVPFFLLLCFLLHSDLMRKTRSHHTPR
ncbi:hypothetical protein E2C01_016875 [Portunus trituberculatus]|uniref:Uncharacterized protein n=1 Tax=Portunus trituberculatus TaxID=210409 RepID=A0A5B7DQT7_PORTR|nr:hypothetical protein [Portunus trituberculatus]